MPYVDGFPLPLPKKNMQLYRRKVLKDPRMLKMVEEGPMPFDPKRRAYGGFRVIVDL